MALGPGNGFDLLLKSVAADVLLRPWFDDAALRLLANWYFPLSRAWAAAIAAEGSVERFRGLAPCGELTGRLLPGILKQMKRRLDRLDTAAAAWEQAFFGDGPPTAEAETFRADAAQPLMAARALFAPLHLERPFDAVQWQIEQPDSVTARHGSRLDRPETAFEEALARPAIEASRTMAGDHREDGWLRFDSPVAAAGDTAWARISTPKAWRRADGRGDEPSLVFTHGIAMEPEWWGEHTTSMTALVDAGVRMIRPEGPWHGRRRLAGFYGGEPVLGRGPAGLLDFFHAHVTEIGILTAWARNAGSGPVAVGGISLGALTAQLVAVAARHWPDEMRPDALFLVTPSRSLTAIAFEGGLTGALGVPDALAGAGWTPLAAAAWAPLLEPIGEPALPADRIVVVLGETDTVTLYAEGEALVRDWGVPEANVFRRPAGHFSASLGLARDDAPLRRFVSVLESLG